MSTNLKQMTILAINSMSKSAAVLLVSFGPLHPPKNSLKLKSFYQVDDSHFLKFMRKLWVGWSWNFASRAKIWTCTNKEISKFGMHVETHHQEDIAFAWLYCKWQPSFRITQMCIQSLETSRSLISTWPKASSKNVTFFRYVINGFWCW